MQVFISVDGVLGNAMVMDFPDVAIVCTFVFLVMNQPAVLSRTRLRILHPLPAALKLHTTTAPLPISGHAPPPQRPSGSECTAQPRCPSQRPAPPSPVPPGGGASARRSAMAAAAFCSPCSALRSGLAPLCRWRALPHPASRRAGSVPRSAARYGTPPFSSSSSLLLLLALPEGRGGPARPCPALSCRCSCSREGRALPGADGALFWARCRYFWKNARCCCGRLPGAASFQLASQRLFASGAR